MGMTGPLLEACELSRGAVAPGGATIGTVTGGARGIVDGTIGGAAGTATGDGAATRGIGRTMGGGFRTTTGSGGSNRTMVGGSESMGRGSIQRGTGIMPANAARNTLVVTVMETPRLDQFGPSPRSLHLGPFVASIDVRPHPP
ncbi:MAG TPA: hypothetical protein VF785_20625 [Gemmatimonadaceae bacterium]